MSIKGNLDGWGWKDKVICVPFNLLEGRKLFFKFRNRTELSTLLHDELHKVWNMLHGSLYHKSVKIVKFSSGWRIKTKKNYKPIGRTHLMTTPVREEPSKLARYFPLLPHLARGQGWGHSKFHLDLLFVKPDFRKLLSCFLTYNKSL